MGKIKLNLINEICEEQNFDELLLEILRNNKENKIKKILQTIDKNTQINNEIKMQLYDNIFEYVNEINEYCKTNIKEIFSRGAKETIKKINSIYSNELLKGKYNMDRKIKIIIVDDNVYMCEILKKFLASYEDIDILGIANTDEDEIKMIEELNPEIVITDLMRNYKYTGLDIIKDCFIQNKNVEFLVISADNKEDLINNGLEVAGYIKKPVKNYEDIYIELKRIKSELEKKNI